MIFFFLLQMSLENDDKRARTRSKSVRGEWERWAVQTSALALPLLQIGFAFTSPGLTLQVMLTSPALSPLKSV